LERRWLHTRELQWGSVLGTALVQHWVWHWFSAWTGARNTTGGELGEKPGSKWPVLESN
jgi:hypothetical protein